LSFCLINEVPFHKDIWGDRGIGPRFLISELEGGVVQFHAPADLPPGQESPVTLEKKDV
jgi:hypothetical protein